MCPICGSVETVKNLGNHLYHTHSASAIRCPGKRCLGFKVKHTELADHIQAKHFQVTCTKCDEKVDARKIRFVKRISVEAIIYYPGMGNLQTAIYELSVIIAAETLTILP